MSSIPVLIAIVAAVCIAIAISRMAASERGVSATAFVDDAVLGTLPLICAKTGGTADGRLPIEVGRRRASAWWMLLLLLGPIGWVVLACLMVFGDRSEVLVLRLPLSDAAMLRYVRARRLATAAMLASTLGLVGVLLAARAVPGIGGPVLAIVVVAAIVALIVYAAWETYVTGVAAELDLSRRWLYLYRVHPDFAAEVDRVNRRSTTRLRG